MPDIEAGVVEDLVGNAHGNLARVRELLDAHPEALNLRAPWNETAIEAATQMGNQPILDFLIARGAPVDFFTACVLGGSTTWRPSWRLIPRAPALAESTTCRLCTSPPSEATSRWRRACWRRAQTSTRGRSRQRPSMAR
jgi:hypothetical protein